MSKTSVMVLGAGGHAKVLISALKAQGHVVGGILDDDETLVGNTILGVEILGGVNDAGRDDYIFLPGVGNNALRKKWDSELDVEWGVAQHPQAYVHESVHIGPGSVVFAGAVVQPDSRIGRHSIINTSASVDHDCRVGDFCHVAPGVHLSGGVELCEGAFMGVGASAIPQVRVGAWSVVGAGATCIENIPSRKTAVGCPAKAIERKEVRT